MRMPTYPAHPAYPVTSSPIQSACSDNVYVYMFLLVCLYVHAAADVVRRLV